jgi:hypothetical protein
MSVRKAQAQLLTADGQLIGEGRAYLHLRQPDTEQQPAQGTLSLDWWKDMNDETGDPRLELLGGPTLTLRLESDRLSHCIAGRILRYQTIWPGLESRAT